MDAKVRGTVVPLDDHFRELTKMISISKGVHRPIQDFMLTRYANSQSVRHSVVKIIYISCFDESEMKNDDFVHTLGNNSFLLRKFLLPAYGANGTMGSG